MEVKSKIGLKTTDMGNWENLDLEIEKESASEL